MDAEGWMRRILARRREEGTFRELRTPEQDRCFVDFTSNDYLGLGRAADLRQAAELEAERARKVCLWATIDDRSMCTSVREDYPPGMLYHPKAL